LSAWSSYASSFSNLYATALAAANDCPVFDASWGDAARFCNWLQNGQPSFLPGNPGEVAGSTETGAYTLNGATSISALMGISRNVSATYFIPTENEWYKAAYYNPNNGTYWAYPTQRNTAPSNALSATGTNNANYYASGYTDPTNCLTPVGVFAASPGPYGTYDMGGDLFQWNETNYNILNEYRGLRGGSWYYDYNYLASGGSSSDYPTNEFSDLGFRVASVPEPSAITLLFASAACVLGYVWRGRRRNS
jgi:formylglycine-generating enzyme required for sulfatase activity